VSRTVHKARGANQPPPRLYTARDGERMKELEGAELARFHSRAITFLTGFLLAVALFMAAALASVKLLFFCLSHDWGNGKTLGKRLTGIRVVSLLHPRPSLWHALERSLGYGAAALELGFGFLQYFIRGSPAHRLSRTGAPSHKSAFTQCCRIPESNRTTS